MEFEMPQFQIRSQLTLLTVLVMSSWTSLDCIAIQAVQEAEATAVLTNAGGMTQGLARFGLPGGPPVAFLDVIDGKEPKDFGLKGTSCIKHRGEAKTCSFGEKFNVTLTEGKHTLHVWFNQALYNNRFATSNPMDLKFVAGAGHRYVVQCIEKNGGWIPVVIDVTEKAHPQLAITPQEN